MEKKSKHRGKEILIKPSGWSTLKQVRIRPNECSTLVRIVYVPDQLAKELMNISKNSFVALSKILRKHFAELVDQYPDIKSQTNNLNHQLTLIAKRNNVDKNYFLKIKLREIADSYPERMRKDVTNF